MMFIEEYLWYSFLSCPLNNKLPGHHIFINIYVYILQSQLIQVTFRSDAKWTANNWKHNNFSFHCI